jgi:ATP-binding cassette subfamily F protein uup
MQEVAGKSDFVTFGDEKIHVRTYLKRFLFTDERVTMRVRELSGGEQSRVLLAKILQRGGNFLILDEPTNDLDLETMRVLEEAVLAFGGCVLVVSHDRYFLDRVCTRTLAFEGEGRIHQCSGNFSYYHEKRAQQAKAELKAIESPVIASPKPVAATSAPVRKMSNKEQRELEQLEKLIAALEAEINAKEDAMTDPTFFANLGAGMKDYLAEIETKRAELETKLERWAALEELRVSMA